jgi:hypothetical protein
MSKKKLLRWGVFGFPLILIFSQCLNFKKTDQRGSAYAGAAACMNCHSNIYSNYLHTAHYIASQPATEKTIQGSFKRRINELAFNPVEAVVMQQLDSGFYQTKYEHGQPTVSRRFDIVFGGIKGQTYAYWLSNQLFQLPVSSADGRWTNSPGYSQAEVDFSRVIGTKCLGCHMSYAKQAPPGMQQFYGSTQAFDKSSVVYSIDCERCHGPGEEHVKFQTENPAVKEARYITRFESLSRVQKLNMCAVCHSGASNHLLKPTFGFKPGDTLSNYMTIVKSNAPANFKEIDVHGNQMALLASSKCFIGSNMDCSTCHDTHVADRNNLSLYTSKCVSCHNSNTHNQCKLTNTLSDKILTTNCISCHMPALPSKVIVVQQGGALVHTHHIAVYPDETKRILASLKLTSR